MEPDAVEIRVIGCLIEKQRTTPDAYPLSLNALRLACNQSTNRDPVVSYDEETVSEALRRTAQRGWTRLASATLEQLVERELVVRHPRRAGQKEDRYEQLLGGETTDGAPTGSPSVAEPEPSSSGSVDEDRIDRIEREIAALRAELSSLREALGENELPSA